MEGVLETKSVKISNKMKGTTYRLPLANKDSQNIRGKKGDLRGEGEDCDRGEKKLEWVLGTKIENELAQR